MPYNKIRIRDDDVLVHSSSFRGQEFGRFKGFHNLVQIDPRHFHHVLAVLVTEIQDFPECIQYVKEETAAGRMSPEVHGLHHIDYAALSYAEVVEQLTSARLWIESTLEYVPTTWYSPWGAGADVRGTHLAPAAQAAGLTLVTCADMIEPSALVKDVREVKAGTMTKEDLYVKWEGKEILRHWWQGVGALEESIQFFKENF
jgi:hypothetical protein